MTSPLWSSLPTDAASCWRASTGQVEFGTCKQGRLIRALNGMPVVFSICRFFSGRAQAVSHHSRTLGLTLGCGGTGRNQAHHRQSGMASSPSLPGGGLPCRGGARGLVSGWPAGRLLPTGGLDPVVSSGDASVRAFPTCRGYLCSPLYIHYRGYLQSVIKYCYSVLYVK